jgi:hypothetical protein
VPSLEEDQLGSRLIELAHATAFADPLACLIVPSMELALAALLGAVFGWAANQFLPGIYRHITRQPAIHVFVETDPAIIWAGAPSWVGASYLVADTAGLRAPPSNFCPDWYGWLRDRGAIPGGMTEAEITLTAGTDLTILLDGIRAKVVRRGRPPDWINLRCAVAGADITPRHISIDLDTFDPLTTSFVDESGGLMKTPRLTLSRGEAEKFYVMAQAPADDVEWTAELLAIVNGKRRIFAIDDNGKPFRTCATEGLPTHEWYGTEWQPPLP